MTGALYAALRPLLFRLEPERAHRLALSALAVRPRLRAPADDPRLAQTVMGLDFPNPIGLAAGFDKNAEVPDALLGLGFGSCEVGTLTPRPQDGNPAPRLFRLEADRALVNRLGFNNDGYEAALARLSCRRRSGIVGVNIGANKDSTDRAGDFVAGITAFAPFASYFMINISSPNTPGLRDLQAPAALTDLLRRIDAARRQSVATGSPRRPIAVKLAPDIADADLGPICDVLSAAGVDAIAVSNTTSARDGATDFNRTEVGGLSGRPLLRRSTRMLARVHAHVEGRLPLIGIGGVDSGETALAKIEAGASLVQLYTSLVYEGPGLVRRIKRDLVRILGGRDIAGLVGTKARSWAETALE